MATSRNRKDHKEKSKQFKQKTKAMKNQVPNMPEVQSIPTWSADAKIEVTGSEWEALQNGLTQIQLAQQAAQAVMTRAIINGVIKMDFEKLNPQTLQYEPMSDEEKATHVENFNKAIENVKKAAAGEVPEPTVVEEEPKSNIIVPPTAE